MRSFFFTTIRFQSQNFNLLSKHNFYLVLNPPNAEKHSLIGMTESKILTLNISLVFFCRSTTVPSAIILRLFPHNQHSTVSFFSRMIGTANLFLFCMNHRNMYHTPNFHPQKDSTMVLLCILSCMSQNLHLLDILRPLKSDDFSGFESPVTMSPYFF